MTSSAKPSNNVLSKRLHERCPSGPPKVIKCTICKTESFEREQFSNDSTCAYTFDQRILYRVEQNDVYLDQKLWDQSFGCRAIGSWRENTLCKGTPWSKLVHCMQRSLQHSMFTTHSCLQHTAVDRLPYNTLLPAAARSCVILQVTRQSWLQPIGPGELKDL